MMRKMESSPGKISLTISFSVISSLPCLGGFYGYSFCVVFFYIIYSCILGSERIPYFLFLFNF